MTAVTAEQTIGTTHPARSTVDRILAALPLATVFLWVCLIYAYQAWAHHTPWLFSDEIEYTDLSRAINATGHPSLRGQPHSYDSLYSYLLAPVWWIHSTATAYALAKYLGVVVMAAAIFPTYALARMLVRPVPALVAAALVVTVPALSYSAFLITEPLAYTWAALCFWLLVKALVSRRWPWLAGAVAAVGVASAVRSELKVLVPVAVGAVAWFLWTSEPVARRRRGWGVLHWAAAALVAVVLGYAANRLAAAHSVNWHLMTVELPDRALRYGVWAVGALTIGLGVLPVVAGLTTLVRPAGPRTPAHRAFVGVFASSIVAFSLYTAGKATYLSTVFAIRVEERNVIYLVPLVAVAFAVWLDRPRVRLWALALSGSIVGYLVVATPYQLGNRSYSDATGLSILTWANRHYRWGDTSVQQALLGALAFSLVAVAVASFDRFARVARPLVAFSALGVLAWALTGEISAANGASSVSRLFVANLPQPLNWIDRATGGRPAMYVGQSMQGGNGLWSLEFWNRSIRRVGSLDGSAPGPGQPLRPSAYRPDGTVVNDPGFRYVIAGQGVDFAGAVVAERGGDRVLRVHGPLRLRSNVVGVDPDGWAGATASFARYAAPRPQRGVLEISVSRGGWNIPADVVVRIGTLVPPTPEVLANPCYTRPCGSLDPHIGKVTAIRRGRLTSGGAKTFVVPVTTPVLAEVTVDPTFRPIDYGPGQFDSRQLGVRPSFTFRPTG